MGRLGASGGAGMGVLSVGTGWSRAAEGLRSRRLASTRSASIVIGFVLGWALLACLCPFQHLIAGLTNRTLRELITGSSPATDRRR